MAELKVSELVEPGLLEAPLVLSKNMEKLILTLGKYKDVANNISRATENETKSLIKLGEENKKLMAISKDFIKTQKDIVTETNKTTKAKKEQAKETEEVIKKTGKATNELTNLRKELRETQSELIKLARTTGTQSKEFLAAAEKAGKLKDELNDMNDAIKNTSASPFENFATQLGNVGSKLKSMDFEGARVAASQLASTSKNITFKEALTGLKQLGSTLLTTGKAILTNPLFLLSALFIGIAVAVYKLRDSIKPLKIAFDFVGTAMDKVTQAGKDFLDWLGLSTFALDAKAEATANTAASELTAIEERYAREKELAEATGKDVSGFEKKKWEEIKNEALIGYASSLDVNNKIRKGQEENFMTFVKSLSEANHKLAVINAEDSLRIEQDKRFKMLALTKEHVKATKTIIDSGADTEIKDSEAKFQKLSDQMIAHIEKIKSTEGELAAFRAQKRYEELQKTEEGLEFALQSVAQLANGTGAILDSLQARKLAKYKEEQDVLDDQYNKDISRAGNNAREKERIERKYSQQKSAIEAKITIEKERVAKFDKATALLQASIQTTLLIIKSLSNPLYIPAAIAAGLQTTAIALKPIPKYEVGTSHSNKGAAIINERGPELLQEPDGKMKMYDSDGAMLTTLKGGTKVFTADQTKKILGAGLRGVQGNRFERGAAKSNELLLQIMGLRHDIKNKKEIHFSINREGAEMMVSRAETRTKFLDTFYA